MTHESFKRAGAQIFYTRWQGASPKAVLQIAHGMAEHIDRYDGFARFMAEAGYAVYGDDHRGHGKTGRAAGTMGKLGEREGYRLVTDDMKRLTDIAKGEHPGLPVILLGHSMGSFLARHYAALYSDGIDGLIIMGTSGKNPGASVGIKLVNLISRFKGEDHRSAFVNNIGFGTYNKRFEGRTEFDWLSADRDNVDRYMQDDGCGFCFTLSGFRDLFSVLRAVSSDGWAQSIRKDLPVFIVSGADDPVGGYGKGVREVYDRLVRAGVKSVGIKLYEGMRHEILNDRCRDEVFADIRSWCDGVVTGTTEGKR